MPMLPVSPRPQTPPSSPATNRPTLGSDHVQLFVDLLKAVQVLQTAPAAVEPAQSAFNTQQASEEKENLRARASKLEFKIVNEI